MFDFFNIIVGFFETIWSYICNFFSALVTAFTIMRTAISLPISIVGFMPTFIGTAIVVFLLIAVIRFVVGVFL